ncbi:MarR family winged helix-turn-helix transcriptional regulator [Micromonospora sp. NPDC050397]|uniref:MarR family winged helix-turn-helix transcriptional regulator n=1 Tax=Micromonospora sp. NPDC050397 TaxID=3364279 RepID=UPI00384F472C
MDDDVDAIARAWARERPGTPVGSIGVITRIWRIGKILNDERRRTLNRLGIDAATLDLLSTLRRAGRPYTLAPGELARLSLVSAGAISQRVARAEQSGLVCRKKAGPDGRGVLVTLTTAGHRLLDRSVDALLTHEEGLLDALSADQRDQVSDLLRVLLADLTERVGTDGRSGP